MPRPDESPLISIIIVFLNAERFFTEAIESALSQTHKNWELLLVDDGSTDASTEIALRYSRRWPSRIRYLQHEDHKNLGMSASRNLGIKNARGDYIAFLDSDDVWLKNKLERQMRILEDHPNARVVYGPALIWHSWTGAQEDLSRDRIQDLGVKTNDLVHAPQVLAAFLQAESASPIGCLIRREVFDQVGGFEDSFHSSYEDGVFFAKVCLKETVFASNEVWYMYRRHRYSSSGSLTYSRHSYLRLEFLRWVASYMAGVQVDDDLIRSILHREMRTCRRKVFLAPAYNFIRWVAEILRPLAKRSLPTCFRRWLANELYG